VNSAGRELRRGFAAHELDGRHSEPMRSRISLPWIATLVVAGLLVGLVAAPGALGKAGFVRKQIKKARVDLVRFEQDLAELIDSFEGLQTELDAVIKDERAIRVALRETRQSSSFYANAVATFFVEPLLRERLAQVATRKELVEALVPALRREIWARGDEREEKIETLDAAIQLLESTRSGELVTNAGVGGGQLITYSADWAAVSMCESSGRWHINDYFDGGLQFLPTTWWGFGGGEYAQFAYQATRRQQIDIAERVLAVQGPNAWPNCFVPLPIDTDE
jgi:Transglycosylase-like domain